MIRKYRAIMLAALILGLIPMLHESAQAFELFPRPQRQYTVKRGDTLYGVAGLYYSNPALWPHVWNQNPSVKIEGKSEPEYEHLIPGTKLNIYHPQYPYSLMNQEYLPPTGIPDEMRFRLTAIPFKGIPYDRKYFRYKLSLRPTRVWGYIVTSPDQGKIHYLERDLVYVRFRPSKRQCILVGDRFGVYRDRGPLGHPRNPDRPVGFLSEVVGEVEVVNTGHDLVTAIVLDSYEELMNGDKVCLFTPRPKEIVPTKTHKMLTGTILRSVTRKTWYIDAHNLENDIVFIDRGESDGMKEGMLVNIYRPSHPVMDPHTWKRLSTPDAYLGEGMILKAFEKNSTVLITRMREEILPGDIIKSVSD